MSRLVEDAEDHLQLVLQSGRPKGSGLAARLQSAP